MKCPYCAEEIKEEAIACRYCGRDLSFFKPMLDSIYKPVLERVSSLEAQISDIAASLEVLKTNRRTTAKPDWARIGLTTFWSFLISGWGPIVGYGILRQYHLYLTPRVYTSFTTLLVIIFVTPLLYGGVRVGLAWPGRHLKGYTALSWLAGSLLIITLVGVLGGMMGTITIPEDFTIFSLLSAIVFWVYCLQTLLFVSGGLFADLWKMRKEARGERESGLAQKVADKVTAPGKEPSNTKVLVIQASITTSIAAVGTILSSVVLQGFLARL